ncbi:DUF1501 domain-containing protein [Phormidesmis priestleyi]
MHRRQFLQAGLFSTASLVAIGAHGWAARATTPNSKRLIVIFLRGAVDGLNVVIPYQEAAYYQARPTIAIAKPGQDQGAIDLNGQFGLHPALQALMPLWEQKNLAFVHACGSPDSTRSHFDAQDYMESGTPGIKKTQDGWMNRLLAVMSGHTPIQAVSVGATTPRILSGKMTVATIASGRNANKPLPLDRPQVSTAFDQLYRNTDALSQAYQEGRTARQALLKDLDSEMKQANNGAPLPNGFAIDTRRLAQLMVRDDRIQLAFLALGGWDTHINQSGQLTRNLQFLRQGLTALQQGLGSVYADTTILVMSEFGRTVHENGNRGTDHGHGNVLWLMGGEIQGGKTYGQWPGLAADKLYQGRDLAVTTDFREVIAEVLTRSLKLDDRHLAQVFPNYTTTQRLRFM